ncbi:MULTISPECIES: DUF2515 family protein [Pontibacillus]|uniref:DUF2515 family protein n=1 Tax=Pontibacillus chungwhensis TaxID=265426 RepID=A0ABY8V2I3_9BACI|nr:MULTISPECIES: DUF2515 family protein [Pontibacillus]MCD5325677.1 DUF2515 domain-containing protein [Pontibacillus sp. HN14]WIF98081.1 DUF2515 family protein [Pontibacillus chungwhensis]
MFSSWKKQSNPTTDELVSVLKSKTLKEDLLPYSDSTLSVFEQSIVNKITKATKVHNETNITRTNAYLSFYNTYPEIEWALLAHLVSRNSGWNMTDLKGEWLSKLLSEKEQRNYFRLLERANWLIFQDAYPQLLLYHYSLKHNLSLYHLLPAFQVSRFMEPVWNHFSTHQDRTTLSTALIINEQHYIEKRVIHNKFFKQAVLDTLDFKVQEWLGLTQILFPYSKSKKFNRADFTGLTVHQFASLSNRIEFGKKLYVTLFSDPKRLQSIKQWADQHPHTGSRKDYWPHLFHTIRESPPGKLSLKLERCQLRKGAARVYSPPLNIAWEIIEHHPPSPEDWFTKWDDASLLHGLPSSQRENMTEDHCEALTKIELAVAAKQIIFHRQD